MNTEMTIRAFGPYSYSVNDRKVNGQELRHLLYRFYKNRYPQGSTPRAKYERFITLKVQGVTNGFRRASVVTVK